MLAEYRYLGSTAVENRPGETEMSFSPDLSRDPTYFSGELGKSVEFREAVSALHDVVVGDLRYKPKDKSDYKAWLAENEQFDLAAASAEQAAVAERITALKAEIAEIGRRRTTRWGAYNKAVMQYRKWLWANDPNVLVIFDPVITVHPDEVFFECFSKDESCYGRLGASFDVFKNVGEFAFGTTNVDYSAALYDEFQKIRTYKTTTFKVEASGFGVQTGADDAYKEVKIDLPDSWVRGFLQVSSAMSLPATSFELDPMDVHNICFVLRRHREKLGPRGLRYHLEPGKPVRVVFEPWGIEVDCPRSLYEGRHPAEIRVWGRRRLLMLERLIPVARRFTVHLLGTGLPSFYVADLGDMSFTLGLSGWTANDWSRAGNFDLMAPRTQVDDYTKRLVFEGLKRTWYATPDDLAARLGMERPAVLGALGAWTQAGRAIYDLNKGVYRARELSRDPLPVDRLRFANPREESANRFLGARLVKITETTRDSAGNMTLLGTVKDGEKTFDTTLTTDSDERILRAACRCNWHQQNKLFKGPCEHILALRMEHSRRYA